MFKKIECVICHEHYDGAECKCPKCGFQNTQNSDAQSSRNVTFLHVAKQIGLFAIGWGGFELIGFIISLIYAAVGRNVYGYSGQSLTDFLSTVNASMVINFVSYGVVFAGLVLLLFKDNIKLLKAFKNWKGYIAGAVCYLCIMAFDLLYNLILGLCGIELKSNDNQALLEQLILSAPILSILIFGIIGPVCEELTYRVGLYSFFRRINKYLALFVTAFIFTLIHFNFTSTDLVNEVLNIPTYFFAAIALTFTYSKFGFSGSVSAHITNNMVSVLVIISKALVK